MKTLTLLFTLLSLYLLANQAHSTFNPIRLPTADNAAVASGTAVLDVDGEEVQIKQDYYVVPAFRRAGGGGLKLAILGSWSECPSDVIQSQNSFDLGNPITFTSAADPNATIVSGSTFYVPSFNVLTKKLCQDKEAWTIDYNRGSGQYFVKAGEVDNLSNQFKIEKIDANLNVYKFTYCQYGTNKCYDVGTYYDRSSKATRLALSNDPFVVAFKKVSDDI